MTEKEFTKAVIEMAQLFGWLCAHFRPAMTQKGAWVTAMMGDTGFPDLVLAHSSRGTLFAELKVGSNKPSKAQQAWLHALAESGQEAHLWYPRDFADIEARLRGKARAA